jgi:hypothetical protein
VPNIEDPRPLIVETTKELRNEIKNLHDVTKRIEKVGNVSLLVSIIALAAAAIALIVSMLHL